MKKFGALALALTMAASLSVSALAAGEPALIAPNPDAGYSTEITINGVALDTSNLPAADGLPLRLVVEADHGSAYWSEDEGTGSFYLDGYTVTVTFATGAVSIDDKALDGVTAQVENGVTFLPVSIFEGLEGYTVNTNLELDVRRVDITTPNSDPMIQLAYQIMDASSMANGMKTTPADMEQYHDIQQAHFTQSVAFFPMMVSPDSLIIGKLAPGANQDAVKAELEAYRKTQEDTFSWYLSQNLPKVQNAQTVFENGYVLFLIAEDADKGVDLFQTWAKTQAE